MNRNCGFTLIEMMVVILIMGIVCSLLVPQFTAAREAQRRAQCFNNLKQLALAAAGYEARHGAYPYGVGGGAPAGRVPRWSAFTQLLGDLDQGVLFNAINFSGVPWSSDPVYGAPNRTALTTSLSVLLCPSDVDMTADPYRLGHISYRGNAGTLPYNIAAGSADGLGRNNGAFWFQSALKITDVTDGTSNTALFSERCLGNRSGPDIRADYFLNGPDPATCANVAPGSTARYAVAGELSGMRWGDGALFYTRYNHILTPNKPSCLLGGANDHGFPVVVTASSRHPGGVLAAFMDGTVRFTKDSTDKHIWVAFGTYAGGEVLSCDCY